MFASTNLVFELGIVLWIFLGPAFTAAEFVGGFVLILLMWGSVRLFVSTGEEEAARAHALAADTDHHHTISAGQRPWRDNLTSVQAWSDVAHNCHGDWQMLWEGDDRRISDRRIRRAPAAERLRGRVSPRRPRSGQDGREHHRRTAHRRPELRLLGRQHPARGRAHQTPQTTRRREQTVYFCSTGCNESFDADPDGYADRVHGTLGGRPRGLLKEPS